MDTPITIVEMCAGYGGIGLGLRRIFGEKLRTIAYSEIEAAPIELLLTRMEEGQLDEAPIWSDLKSFPWQDLNGLVSILVAGYPCQPFSAAGNRKGEDDPRHLFPYIREGIRKMRPTLCFFENVEGHLSLGLEQVIGDLEELGYESAFCLCSASEVGLPHKRKRVFILSYDKSQRVEGLWADWIQESYAYARKALSLRGGEADCSSPARPDQSQYWWEPPRVLGDSKHNGSFGNKVSRNDIQTGNGDPQGQEVPVESAGASGSNDLKDLSVNEFGEIQYQFGFDEAGVSSRSEAQPSLCGGTHGSADWMDYVNLCKSYHNREIELKLLGNGVCPLQAERAYHILISELGKKLYDQATSHTESTEFHTSQTGKEQMVFVS